MRSTHIASKSINPQHTALKHISAIPVSSPFPQDPFFPEMEYENEDRLCVTMEELFSLATEDGSSSGRLSRKRNYGDDKEYKSKNLETERRRREKLSSRLLTLRSLMNKAAIVNDAITFIKKLQDQIQSLTQELHNMEATSDETSETKMDEMNAAEDMKKWGIQEEVTVEKINENKLWVKIIIEKKRGRFTKLMESMNNFGIELIDTNNTTTKGAFLITGCIQGMNGKRLEAYQTKKLLQDIISGI